eukprot:scaffold285138_cov16-Tisochrysis_lutea.AAC.1
MEQSGCNDTRLSQITINYPPGFGLAGLASIKKDHFLPCPSSFLLIGTVVPRTSFSIVSKPQAEMNWFLTLHYYEQQAWPEACSSP